MKIETDSSKTRAGTTYKVDMTEVTVTVATALPQFSTANPRAWFRLAQARLTSSGLTKDEDKINKVLEALPPEVFNRLAPWLDTQPEDGGSYAELKDELLSYYTGSKTTRATQMLNLITHPETDNPSARWRQLEALQYNADGTKIDVLWELWMASLPPQVSVQLDNAAASTSTEKAAVTRRADSIQKRLANETTSSASTAAVQPASGSRKPQQQKSNQPRDEARDKIIDGFCWYHRVFKHRSRRCLEGCKKYVDMPKNASGNQQ